MHVVSAANKDGLFFMDQSLWTFLKRGLGNHGNGKWLEKESHVAMIILESSYSEQVATS